MDGTPGTPAGGWGSVQDGVSSLELMGIVAKGVKLHQELGEAEQGEEGGSESQETNFVCHSGVRERSLRVIN